MLYQFRPPFRPSGAQLDTLGMLTPQWNDPRGVGYVAYTGYRVLTVDTGSWFASYDFRLRGEDPTLPNGEIAYDNVNKMFIVSTVSGNAPAYRFMEFHIDSWQEQIRKKRLEVGSTIQAPITLTEDNFRVGEVLKITKPVMV